MVNNNLKICFFLTFLTGDLTVLDLRAVTLKCEWITIH